MFFQIVQNKTYLFSWCCDPSVTYTFENVPGSPPVGSVWYVESPSFSGCVTVKYEVNTTGLTFTNLTGAFEDCNDCYNTNGPCPSPTPTQTPTQTQTPTKTPTPTPTVTKTQTQTVTNTKTPTQTPTVTSTQTGTPTVTPTNTLTQTQTPSNTNTNTPTSITQTPTPTYTPTPTEYPQSGRYGVFDRITGANECTVITLLPMDVECVLAREPIAAGSSGLLNLTITGGTPPYFTTWTYTTVTGINGFGSFSGSGTQINITGPVGSYTAVTTDFWGDFVITTVCSISYTPPTPTPSTTPPSTPLPNVNPFCLNFNYVDPTTPNPTAPNIQLQFTLNALIPIVNGKPSWICTTTGPYLNWIVSWDGTAWVLRDTAGLASPINFLTNTTYYNGNPANPNSPIGEWAPIGFQSNLTTFTPIYSVIASNGLCSGQIIPTPTRTQTPTKTPTPTTTSTPSATVTNGFVSSPTPTSTITSTPTLTNGFIPSATPTETPTPTPTPTNEAMLGTRYIFKTCSGTNIQLINQGTDTQIPVMGLPGFFCTDLNKDTDPCFTSNAPPTGYVTQVLPTPLYDNNGAFSNLSSPCGDWTYVAMQCVTGTNHFPNNSTGPELKTSNNNTAEKYSSNYTDPLNAGVTYRITFRFRLESYANNLNPIKFSILDNITNQEIYAKTSAFNGEDYVSITLNQNYPAGPNVFDLKFSQNSIGAVYYFRIQIEAQVPIGTTGPCNTPYPYTLNLASFIPSCPLLGPPTCPTVFNSSIGFNVFGWLNPYTNEWECVEYIGSGSSQSVVQPYINSWIASNPSNTYIQTNGNYFNYGGNYLNSDNFLCPMRTFTDEVIVDPINGNVDAFYVFEFGFAQCQICANEAFIYSDFLLNGFRTSTQLTTQILTQQPQCGCDGSITFNTFGVPPYSYSIDGGQTYTNSPIFVNLCPNTYSLIAIDLSGSTFIDTQVLNNIPNQTVYDLQITQSVSTTFDGLDGLKRRKRTKVLNWSLTNSNLQPNQSIIITISHTRVSNQTPYNYITNTTPVTATTTSTLYDGGSLIIPSVSSPITATTIPNLYGCVTNTNFPSPISGLTTTQTETWSVVLTTNDIISGTIQTEILVDQSLVDNDCIIAQTTDTIQILSANVIGCTCGCVANIGTSANMINSISFTSSQLTVQS